MAKTKIEWTDVTWNPVRGCQKVSEGCRNCYAARMAARFSGPGMPYEEVAEMTEHGPRWTGEIRLVPEVLDQPLRWRKPRRIFVNSMSDLFHDEVPIDFIAKVFDVMASLTAECGKNHLHSEECWTGPRHTFQILTKRPERMVQILEELPHYVSERFPGDSPLSLALDFGEWPLPNVWLGVSVENQQTADERIPLLLQTPAAVRFLSMEPLLQPVDLSRWLFNLRIPCSCGHVFDTAFAKPCTHGGRTMECPNCGFCKCEKADVWETEGKMFYDAPGWEWRHSATEKHPLLDWIIVGGESGPGARPMHPEWVRSLRSQCEAAGVPFFFKQWGEWAPFHDLRCNEPGIKSRKWYNFDPETSVCRIGKKAAGRLLDSQEWNQMPEVCL